MRPRRLRAAAEDRQRPHRPTGKTGGTIRRAHHRLPAGFYTRGVWLDVRLHGRHGVHVRASLRGVVAGATPRVRTYLRLALQARRFDVRLRPSTRCRTHGERVRCRALRTRAGRRARILVQPVRRPGGFALAARRVLA